LLLSLWKTCEFSITEKHGAQNNFFHLCNVPNTQVSNNLANIGQPVIKKRENMCTFPIPIPIPTFALETGS